MFQSLFPNFFLFIDPWDFILQDNEAEEKWKFSLKESLRRSQKDRLLEPYSVQVTTTHATDVLKNVIQACGGKIIQRMPARNSKTRYFVVGSSDERSKYSRYLKMKPAPPVVGTEAIFDGILRQELHLDRYQLT